MELFPGTLPWENAEPPCRVEILPVSSGPARRPPWWKRRERRWWDKNVRPLALAGPKFRLRITGPTGELIIDADDYSLYLILLYGQIPPPRWAYPPQGTS